MATVGLKNLYYAVLSGDTSSGVTYGTPVKIAGAVSVDINPSVNFATLYGDDAPFAADSSMSEIAVTIESCDLKLEDQAALLGQTVNTTTKELAARVNLSTTPVFERLKRLERGGFIQKYVAVLDAQKLGRGFTVFCSVKLKQMNRGVARDFISVIKDIPQVAECYNVSGEYDYLLKIQAPDMKYYNEFIINVLGTIDSIGSILSSFVMDEIKNTHALYL